MATITRHAGIAVHGFIVGGGYEGKTKELDELVQAEADTLRELFNRDVEIRFNSDRESGGAWLKNSLKGFSGNCQVGLCAGLQTIKPDNMTREQFWIESPREFIRSQPKEIYIATNLKADVMRHPEIANSKRDNDDSYDYRYHATLTDAVEFLKTEVVRGKI